MKLFRVWVFIFIITPVCAQSQDADSLLTDVDAELTYEDSISVFQLIDSILSRADDARSQLAVRIGYNSNVQSAGRTLGIKNFGLAPGISYYHTSGLYADVSGYWSKDFVPAYYLTVFSLGYMKDISKKFSVMAEYDKYFYNLSDNYIPYSNTISVTPILELSPVSISVNYSFYFGDETAHRIMPGISYQWIKKNLFKMDRISITPSFFLLTGNEVISNLEIVPPENLREAIRNLKLYGTRYSMIQTNKNVFGIMNYAFTLPLSASYKSWSFLFSYTYNIPKALPGEPLTISESSYLSGSLSYFISRKAK
jgi:hypothetical protein